MATPRLCHRSQPRECKGGLQEADRIVTELKQTKKIVMFYFETLAYISMVLAYPAFTANMVQRRLQALSSGFRLPQIFENRYDTTKIYTQYNKTVS